MRAEFLYCYPGIGDSIDVYDIVNFARWEGDMIKVIDSEGKTEYLNPYHSGLISITILDEENNQ